MGSSLVWFSICLSHTSR